MKELLNHRDSTKKYLTPDNVTKELSEEEWEVLKNEIKMMLHSSRDSLRNRGDDTTKITFSCIDGAYGEAFGIVRGLAAQGYGWFGANNLPAERVNLKWWFDQLEKEVLTEEGFFDHGHYCQYCAECYMGRGSNDEITKRIQRKEW